MKFQRRVGLLLFFFIFRCAIQAQDAKTEYLVEPPAVHKKKPVQKNSIAAKPTPTPKPSPTAKLAKHDKPAATTATVAPKIAKPSPTPKPEPQLPKIQRADTNDIARLIAGMKPLGSGPVAELAKTSEWTNHATYMDGRWQRFETGRLLAIKAWRKKEFQPDVKTVFYPFSGPDFIYLATYFPDATTYILCGLEPVGDLPTVDKIQPLDATFGWLQSSFKTLLVAGYFVTKDMGVDLKMSPLQGTLPLLCVMLVRSGDHIVSIARDANHAEIKFTTPGSSGTRTLHYFCTDLSNSGLAGKGGAFLEFVKRSHPGAAYFKAASYLTHEPEFSTVRNAVLANCPLIVQDDSGIPLRCFDTARWRLQLYGVYAPPLDIFKKYDQPDLAALYAKGGAKPLNFRTGYHWDHNTANLMVATVDAHAASSPVPTKSAAPARSSR